MSVIKPLDYYKYTLIDDKYIKKFKFVYPDSKDRKFTHLKILNFYDTGLTYYSDGVYIYEWECHCSKKYHCIDKTKCKNLACKKGRIPYHIDRVPIDEFFNNKDNMFFSEWLVNHTSFGRYADFLDDLTEEEMKTVCKKRFGNKKYQNIGKEHFWFRLKS